MLTNSINKVTKPSPRATEVSNRILGTLGLMGSPMLLVEGWYVGFQPHGTDRVIGLLGTIYIAGWMCSIVGLRSVRATGHGRGGRAVLIIQLVSLALAGIWSAYHLIAAVPNTAHPLYVATDIAWPFSHLFMIVVGIATLRAKTLTGWPRFSPLLCGLALPAAILTSVIAGETAMAYTFPVWTFVAFAWLGYTVVTLDRSQPDF